MAADRDKLIGSEQLNEARLVATLARSCTKSQNRQWEHDFIAQPVIIDNLYQSLLRMTCSSLSRSSTKRTKRPCQSQLGLCAKLMPKIGEPLVWDLKFLSRPLETKKRRAPAMSGNLVSSMFSNYISIYLYMHVYIGEQTMYILLERVLSSFILELKMKPRSETRRFHDAKLQKHRLVSGLKRVSRENFLGIARPIPGSAAHRHTCLCSQTSRCRTDRWLVVSGPRCSTSSDRISKKSEWGKASFPYEALPFCPPKK